MKRKCGKLCLALLALSVVFLGCSGRSASSGDSEYQKIELTMAVNGTDGQIDTRVGNYFANLVSERSGGNVTIVVFPNDQLANGNASRGVEMIASGNVDIAGYATGTLAFLDEVLQVATIPWTFDDYAHARQVIDTTGGEFYAQVLARHNMVYLGSFHNGFRQLSNARREVRTPADMRDLKIRIPGGIVYMNVFRALGADPTFMNWPEVFTSIQQGTIDGQENGISISATAQMDEVVKYLTMWNYIYESDLIVVNTGIWNSLQPATQQLLQECATEACEWGRDALEAEEADFLKEFEANGMTITYLTDEELDAFKELVAPFKAELIERFGQEACAAFGITG